VSPKPANEYCDGFWFDGNAKRVAADPSGGWILNRGADILLITNHSVLNIRRRPVQEWSKIRNGGYAI
jgi:hypothetical protein